MAELLLRQNPIDTRTEIAPHRINDAIQMPHGLHRLAPGITAQPRTKTRKSTIWEILRKTDKEWMTG